MSLKFAKLGMLRAHVENVVREHIRARLHLDALHVTMSYDLIYESRYLQTRVDTAHVDIMIQVVFDADDEPRIVVHCLCKHRQLPMHAPAAEGSVRETLWNIGSQNIERVLDRTLHVNHFLESPRYSGARDVHCAMSSATVAMYASDRLRCQRTLSGRLPPAVPLRRRSCSLLVTLAHRMCLACANERLPDSVDDVASNKLTAAAVQASGDSALRTIAYIEFRALLPESLSCYVATGAERNLHCYTDVALDAWAA